MKKLMVLSAALLASGLMAKQADAQIRLGLSLHFGARPEYVAPAPVVDDDFYYLPEVAAYYSVAGNCYYYNDGENWVSAAYLPGAYHDYDWRTARRFEIRGQRPYLHDFDYRARFGGVEHRDWNYREGYANREYADREHFDNRVYANRDRFDHNQYRGDDHQMQEPQRNEQWNRGPQQFENRGDDHRGAQTQPQQNDNRGNYGRGQQQQAQPQQNNNRGGQQQAQPQQNNNRGNSGFRGEHFS